MTKRQGMRRSSLVLALLAVVLVGYWGAVLLALGPEDAAPCAAGAPASAPCLRSLPVKVTSLIDKPITGNAYSRRYFLGYTHGVTLTGLPGGPRRAVLSGTDYFFLGLTTGQPATATLWGGKLVQVGAGGKTAYVYGYSTRDRLWGIGASAAPLLVVLLMLRVGRRPMPPRVRPPLFAVDLATLPVLVGALLWFHADADHLHGLLVAVLGTAALAVQLACQQWRSDGPEERTAPAPRVRGAGPSHDAWSVQPGANGVQQVRLPPGVTPRIAA
ncbi:hypothetical protein [Streptacidiphilus sp. PAMC 29251]